MLFLIAILGLGLNARAQTIESAFSLGPLSPYAVFSHQDVTVNGEVSSTGGASTKQGHVRSNGNITVNSNGKIDGDARPGPGKSATGNITGITIPSLESLSPAPIDLAALETQVAAQNDNSKIDSKLIPNRNLTLNSGQSLPLQPGTYYLNNVNINSNATLTVSGLVKILVTGSFNLNATANAGGLAPNLRVWVKSTSSVNINSNAQMRGYVYAPNATVNVNSNATLTGGIFAKQVTVNSNGAVKRWLGTIGLGGPSVAITEPREGDVAANLSAVLVKGTVSDPDGVGTVSVTVNGSPVTPAANGNFEKTVDLSGSSQRRITVTAVDADGQTDTKTVALCGPPPVTLTSPAHGSTVTTQTVTLTGTCGNATTLTVNGSPVTCGGGTYTTSVNLGPGYGAKVITVVAQGACEASTQRFVLFYAANPDYFAMGPWMTGQAVFSHHAFVLDNNGEVRAANASGVTQAKQGHVVSNATVTVKNNGVLDGDAWAGVGQPAPATQNNGKIEGTRGNLTAAVNQRPVDPAAVNALHQTQNNNGALPTSVLTGTEFKLTNNQAYPMPGGTYYFTKFTLENNAKLTLAGAVRIVVNGPVSLGNNVEVNRNGNPYNLRIWMTSAQAAALANNNVFVRGFLYVPDAKVTIDNGVDLRGGIFAKEVEVKNNAKVYRAIDGSAPVVSITQPSEGATPPDLSAVLVSGTVTDADGNLATVHVNGTPVTVQPNGTYSATVNLTGMTPAVITVVAVDLAGQIYVATRTIAACTQTPVITMTSPAPNGFIKTQAITVTGGCTTASTVTVNGVSAPCQSATYSANITLPAGDGTKTITVIGTASGCPSATQNYTVTLDTIPPVIAIDSPAPGATITSSPVTVTGTVTDVNLQAVSVNGTIATVQPAGRFSATLPVTEGSVTLVAAATDKAGNATASAGIAVTVTLSGPSVTITPPAATLVKTQQVTLTGTATGTPPLTVTVNNQPAQVTGGTWTSTITLVEGPNAITARVTDGANRTATSNTVNVELDTQSPRVTIDTPASGCRGTGTVTLGGVYADTHPAATGAVTVEIRPAGGTSTTQTATVDPAARRWTLTNVSLGTTNGTATVTVTAKDSLDQTSKAQAGWRIDTTPPVITLLSSGTPFPVSGSGLTPPQGTSPRLVNSVLSFTAQISDGEEAPPSPVLTLDGQPYTAGTPITTEGQHLLTARATDCAQNEGTAWALFTIDRTGAQLLSTAPAEGAVLTQAPASFSGAADTALSAVKLNGVSVTPSGAGFTQSPYAWKEGLNTVQIELTDTAGNETAYERHFTVRTIRPTVEIVESGVAIGQGAVYYRAITPEFRTNDPQSTVSPLLDGQPYSQGTPIATAGTHTLSATVRDSANQTANASVTFTIDLSGGPSIAITSPADGAEVPGPTVSVTGTATGTGITVMVNGTQASLTGTTWTVPNLPLTPDTINDIVAVVKDSRSRTASAARSVMVRSSGPRIVITEPLAGFATNRKKVDIAGAVVGGKAVIPAGTLNLIPQQGTSRTVTLDATGAFRAQDVPLAPGVNTVTVTGTDAHNRTGSTTAVLTSDQTTPGVSITAGGQPVTEGQTFGGAVTLQITVTDDGTSVPVPEIWLNGAAQAATGATTLVSISQPGGYVVSVAARDAAGNETRVERGFLIDPGSCALTALEPSSGSTTGEAAVTLHGKSGSARAVKVRTASGAEYTALVADGTFAIADLPVAATGTNAFTLVCLDRSGGEHSQSYTLNRLAAGSGPQITLTSPQNGGKQTQSTVTVTGTVSDPAASVRVNGTFVAVNQSTGSFSAVLTISEGPNVIVVEALDVAKRRTVERRLVEKDSQAPEIQITSPLNNQHLGRTEVVVTGRITIEDEPNLQTVVVETVVGTVPVGTVPAVTDPDTGRFRATAPLSGTAGVNTSQTVRVRATDTLGQTSVSEVSVYADPQGPALSLTSPDDLTFVNTALPVSVSGTASGREGARISVNGTLIDPSVLTWSAPDANGRGTSPFTASVPLPSPVPYEGGAGGGPTPFTVVARVEDLDGAFANERRLILIDTVAPSVVEIYPADGARQVDPNTIPLVLFSEPTKASTLAAGLVLVKTGTSEPVAGTHAVSGNAVAFVPAVALTAGQQYRLRALAAITDIASNALATASEVTFTVTADPFAAAPQLDPMPAVTCAQTLHVKGSAASGARIRVKDGTLSATGTADQSGRFDVELPVSGNGYHEIRVTALTSEGDAGPEARVLIRIDCGAPSVTVSSFDRNTGTITVTFTEAMSPETLTVGGPADSIRVSDAEDGSRTAQAGTVTLDTARTTALIQLSTSPGAWWRTKPVRLEVRPPARDAGGNAMAAAYETVFYLGGGPGDLSGSFLAGEVYDEGSGRPLSGVTASLYVSGSSLPGSVRISSQTPPVATQTTDGRGRYAMAGDVVSGRYAVVVEKSGYTRAIRRMALEPGTGFVPFDARLTPLSPAVSLAVATGGTLNGPNGSLIALEVSPHAIPSSAQTVGIQLTPVSGQGLPELLPLGWSPVAASEIRVIEGSEALPEGTATSFTPSGVRVRMPLPEGILPAQQLIAVRYDVVTGTWITLTTPTRTTGSDGIEKVEVTLVGPGTVAVVLADEAAATRPPIPAQAGETLAGVSLPETLPALIGTMTLDPPVVTPSGKALAHVEAHSADNQTPWPSGLAVQAYLDEKLILSDGSELFESPFSADLVLYRVLTRRPVTGVRVEEAPGALTRRSAPPSPASAGEGIQQGGPLPSPRVSGERVPEGGVRGLLGPGTNTSPLSGRPGDESPGYGAAPLRGYRSTSGPALAVSPISGVLEFIVSPSPKAAEVLLESGYDNIRLYPYPRQLERGSVLGPAGGTVTSTDGIELTLPEGSLSQRTLVTARALTAQELQAITVPLGFQLLAGIRIEAAGQSFARGATVTMKTPAGTPADPQGEPRIVLARWEGQPSDGRGAFARVVNRGERIAASGSNPEKVRFAPEAASSTLPLLGIIDEGTYLILRAENAIGYATGFVRAESGLGYLDARATATGLGTADLSLPGGRYAVPVPAGTNKTVSAKHPVLDETGTAVIASLVANAVAQVDITIRPQGPTIQSVQPVNNASGQPIGTPITMQFSEPLDATSVNTSQFRVEIANADGTSTGVQVLGTLAPGSGNTQLVFTPARPLPTGVRILCSFLGGVRDAGGTLYAGAVPYAWSFTTSTSYPWGGQINPAKIRILVPQNGTAQIIGDPGALPATQGTPWSVSPDVDGVVCSPVQGAQANSQGGFGPLVAGCPANPLTLSSIVWLKVLDPAGTLAATIKLGPFTTADGKGFVARAGEETTYTTTEGIQVTVPAEAFGEAKLVTLSQVAPSSISVPMNPGMEIGAAVRVEFDGFAYKSLRVKVPLPPTAIPGRLVFVGEPVTLSWGERLSLIDLARVVDGGNGTRLASNLVADQPADPPSGIKGVAAPLNLGEPGPNPHCLTKLPCVPVCPGAPPAPGCDSTATTLPPQGCAACACSTFICTALAEMTSARTIAVVQSTTLEIGAFVGNAVTGGMGNHLAVLYNTQADTFVYIPEPNNWKGNFILPFRSGTPFSVVTGEGATGWIVREASYSPISAAGGLVALPPPSAETPPEAPVRPEVLETSVGDVIRFRFDSEVTGTLPVCQDLRTDLRACMDSRNVVRVRPGASPLETGTRVELFTWGPSRQNPGSASMTVTAATWDEDDLQLETRPGWDLVLSVSRSGVDPEETREIRLTWSDPVTIPESGTDAVKLEDLGPVEARGYWKGTVPVTVTWRGNGGRTVLTITPEVNLPRAHRFRLVLDKQRMLAPVLEASYLGPSEFIFTTKAEPSGPLSQSPGTLFGGQVAANDMVKLGNLLVVALANGGVAAVDVSALTGSETGFVPYARMSGMRDSARAMATDGHSRVFVGERFGAFWAVTTATLEDIQAKASCREGDVVPWAPELPCFDSVTGKIRVSLDPGFLVGVTASEYGSLVGPYPQGIPAQLEVVTEDDTTAEEEMPAFYTRYGPPGGPGLPQLPKDTLGFVTFSVELNTAGHRADRTTDCPDEERWDRFQRVTVDNVTTGQSWSFDVENTKTGDTVSGKRTVTGIMARVTDRLRIRYNKLTLGYLAIVGSGVTVLDLNRRYRIPTSGDDRCTGRLARYEGQEQSAFQNCADGAPPTPVQGLAWTSSVGVLGKTGEEGKTRGAGTVSVFGALKWFGAVRPQSLYLSPEDLQISFNGKRCLMTLGGNPEPAVWLRSVAVAPDAEWESKGLVWNFETRAWEQTSVSPSVGSQKVKGDLALYTLGAAGIAVLDVTDRRVDKLIGIYRVRGREYYRVQADVKKGLLFAGGYRRTGDPAPNDWKDVIDVFDLKRANGGPGVAINVDERLLFSIEAPWGTNHIAFDDAGMGLLYTWGTNGGQVIPLERPRFMLRGLYAAAGTTDGVVERETGVFVPGGIPTRYKPEDEQLAENRRRDDETAARAFRVRVALPGDLGETLMARVESLRELPPFVERGKSDIGEFAAPAGGDGWPEAKEWLTLRRLGTGDAGESGRLGTAYHLYESKEVVVLLADPRARQSYTRQRLDAETADEWTQCRRCEPPKPVSDFVQLGAVVEGDVKEVLAAGPYIRVVLAVPEAGSPGYGGDGGRTAAALAFFAGREADYGAPVATAEMLGWADWVPSVMQISQKEPALNAGIWETGQRGLSATMVGGEALLRAVDHQSRGRGLDLSIERNYRSGAAGFGPLGAAGWTSPLFAHLRLIPLIGEVSVVVLPSEPGNLPKERPVRVSDPRIPFLVEYHDGKGNVHRFYRPLRMVNCPAGTEWDGLASMCAPQGLYLRLQPLEGGRQWRLLTPTNDSIVFDERGRLVEIRDRLRQMSPDRTAKGSTIRMEYSRTGLLTGIEDDLGRTHRLSYESDRTKAGYGLLKSYSDFRGRTVRYGYGTGRKLETIELPALENDLIGNFDLANPRVIYTYAEGSQLGPNAPLHSQAFSGLKLLGMRLPGRTENRFTISYSSDSGRMVGVTLPGNIAWSLNAFENSARPAGGVELTTPWGFTRTIVLQGGRIGSVTRLAPSLPDETAVLPEPVSLQNGASYYSDGRLQTASQTDGKLVTLGYKEGAGDRLDRSLVQTRTESWQGKTRQVRFSYDKGDRKLSKLKDSLDRVAELAIPFASAVAQSLRFGVESAGSLTELEVRIDFDAHGRPLRKTGTDTPAGPAPLERYTYGRDGAGRLRAGLLQTAERGIGTQAVTETDTYDKDWNLVSRSSTAGQEMSWDYDTWDRVIGEAALVDKGRGEKAVVKRAYDATGLLRKEIEKQTEENGQARWVERTWTYNERDQVVNVTQSHLASLSGAPSEIGAVKYAYDTHGRLESVDSPRQVRSTYQYDSAGRIQAETTGSRTRWFYYDKAGRKAYESDGDEGFWRGNYNGFGELVKETVPGGLTITREFSEAGELKKEKRQAGAGVLQETETDFTSFGALREVHQQVSVDTNPLQEKTRSVEYDGNGRVRTLWTAAARQDQRRPEMVFEYDALGRETKRTDAAGNTWTPRYGAGEYPEEVKHWEFGTGRELTVTLGWDLLGRQVSMTSNSGLRWTRRLSENGNVLEEILGGVSQKHRYDGAGKLIWSKKGPSERTLGYDLDGRLAEEREGAQSGEWITRYEYDYGHGGRVKKVTHPDGSVEEYTVFAPDDMVLQWKNRYGHTVVNTYDAANRVLSMVPSGGPSGVEKYGLSYEYEADGLLKSALKAGDARSAVRFTQYDLGRRLKREEHGEAGALTYEWDHLDRLRSSAAEIEGWPAALSWTGKYDSLDRMTEFGSNGLGGGARWEGAGSPAEVSVTTGTLGYKQEYGYARPGELASLKYSWTSRPLEGFTFRYDEGSGDLYRREREAPLSDLLANQGMRYEPDEKRRLGSAAAGNLETFQYRYGKGDELLEQNRGSWDRPVPMTAGPGGRIAARGSTAYRHDGVGARIEDERAVYGYSWRGELLEVRPKGGEHVGEKILYRYDAVGRLLEREHWGRLPDGEPNEAMRPFLARRSFVWRGDQLVAESGLNFARDVIWRKTILHGPGGPDDPVQVKTEAATQRTYTFVKDEQGTVLSLLAEGESVPIRARYLYTPYGEAHIETGPELLEAEYSAEVTGVAGASQAPPVAGESVPGGLRFRMSVRLAQETLAAGLRVERWDGETGAFEAVDPAGYVAGLDAGNPEVLLVMPRECWRQLEKYRVVLRGGILKDALGRPFRGPAGEDYSATIPIPVDSSQPPKAVLPVFSERFPVTYDSARAASHEEMPGGQPFTYTGAWTDPVSGLIWLRARWYDPKTGTFLQEDPAGFDSPNQYAYVRWSPNMYTDPSGEFAIVPVAAMAAASVALGWGIAELTGNEYTWEDAILDAGLGALGGAGGALRAAGATSRLARGVMAVDRAVDTYMVASAALGLAGVLLGEDDDAAAGEDGEGLLGEAGATITSLGAGSEVWDHQCFPGGTKVQTSNGEKPIEEIVPGDRVPALDPMTGQVQERMVTATAVHVVDNLVTLTIGGQRLETTADHPMLVLTAQGNDWRPAGDLQPGALLYGEFGIPVCIEAVDYRAGPERVWNLTVEGDHTFLVSTGTNAVWVHNANAGIFRRLSAKSAGGVSKIFGGSLENRRLFEGLRSANLSEPNNFPVIDRIYRRLRLGTSLKTIDLMSASAADPSKFRSLVRGYVDKLSAFEGGPKAWRFSAALKRRIEIPFLGKRSLEIGVQGGMLLNWQRTVLRQEAARARRLSKSVSLTVFELF